MLNRSLNYDVLADGAIATVATATATAVDGGGGGWLGRWCWPATWQNVSFHFVFFIVAHLLSCH